MISESTAEEEAASKTDMAFFMLWGHVHHSGNVVATLLML